MRVFVIFAVLVVAAGSAALIYRARQTSAQPAIHGFTALETWRAGEHPAPPFALHDQHGKPISLASVHGKPAIVTFIDPACRELCPLEARVLGAATRELPASQRPNIVAVSVNPWADRRRYFAADALHWQLDSNWHWAVGTRAELARVWRRYQVAVLVSTKKVRGVVQHDVAHTDASFVVDGNGGERAVYVYPFSAKDVAQTLRDVAGG